MRGRAIEHLEGREPSPKLQTCPSAVRARLCAPPAETVTARLSEQTATMVGEARSPSSPTERCRGRVSWTRPRHGVARVFICRVRAGPEPRCL